METILVNGYGKVDRVTHGGKRYFVAPITMIVPGVLTGSKGALHYPKEEIARNYKSWEGMPLTLGHPTQMGMNVSAHTPGIVESIGMGNVRNIKINSQGKLQAQAWFDEELTHRVSKDVYDRLLRNEPIEQSTGLFTQNLDAKPGAVCPYTGRGYSQVATNYRPDHVAVLPNQIGACSISDGCGILVNRGSSQGWEVIQSLGQRPTAITTNCGDTPCGPCAAKAKKRKKKLQPVANSFVLNQTVNQQPSDSLDMSPEKACKILKDGTANGKYLTKAQRGMFGALCGQRTTENRWEPIRNTEEDNCGTGSGGFQKGNSCGGKGERKAKRDEYKQHKADSEKNQGEFRDEIKRLGRAVGGLKAPDTKAIWLKRHFDAIVKEIGLLKLEPSSTSDRLDRIRKVQGLVGDFEKENTKARKLNVPGNLTGAEFDRNDTALSGIKKQLDATKSKLREYNRSRLRMKDIHKELTGNWEPITNCITTRKPGPCAKAAQADESAHMGPGGSIFQKNASNVAKEASKRATQATQDADKVGSHLNAAKAHIRAAREHETAAGNFLNKRDFDVLGRTAIDAGVSYLQGGRKAGESHKQSAQFHREAARAHAGLIPKKKPTTNGWEEIINCGGKGGKPGRCKGDNLNHKMGDKVYDEHGNPGKIVKLIEDEHGVFSHYGVKTKHGLNPGYPGLLKPRTKQDKVDEETLGPKKPPIQIHEFEYKPKLYSRGEKKKWFQRIGKRLGILNQGGWEPIANCGGKGGKPGPCPYGMGEGEDKDAKSNKFTSFLKGLSGAAMETVRLGAKAAGKALKSIHDNFGDKGSLLTAAYGASITGAVAGAALAGGAAVAPIVLTGAALTLGTMTLRKGLKHLMVGVDSMETGRRNQPLEDPRDYARVGREMDRAQRTVDERRAKGQRADGSVRNAEQELDYEALAEVIVEAQQTIAKAQGVKIPDLDVSEVAHKLEQLAEKHDIQTTAV